MSATPAARTLRALDLGMGTLNVLLGTLALAALWALAAMFAQQPLAPAALLLGLGSGWLARMSLPRARRYAAPLAAVACFAAAYYQQVLMAAVRISRTLGLPLQTALFDSGVSLLLLLARIALFDGLLPWVLAGSVLAALTAWPFSRRGS